MQKHSIIVDVCGNKTRRTRRRLEKQLRPKQLRPKQLGLKLLGAKKKRAKRRRLEKQLALKKLRPKQLGLKLLGAKKNRAKERRLKKQLRLKPLGAKKKRAKRRRLEEAARAEEAQAEAARAEAARREEEARQKKAAREAARAEAAQAEAARREEEARQKKAAREAARAEAAQAEAARREEEARQKKAAREAARAEAAQAEAARREEEARQKKAAREAARAEAAQAEAARREEEARQKKAAREAARAEAAQAEAARREEEARQKKAAREAARAEAAQAEAARREEEARQKKAAREAARAEAAQAEAAQAEAARKAARRQEEATRRAAQAERREEAAPKSAPAETGEEEEQREYDHKNKLTPHPDVSLVDIKSLIAETMKSEISPEMNLRDAKFRPKENAIDMMHKLCDTYVEPEEPVVIVDSKDFLAFLGVNKVSRSALLKVLTYIDLRTERLFLNVSYRLRFRNEVKDKKLIDDLVSLPWNHQGDGHYLQILLNRVIDPTPLMHMQPYYHDIVFKQFLKKTDYTTWGDEKITKKLQALLERKYTIKADTWFTRIKKAFMRRREGGATKVSTDTEFDELIKQQIDKLFSKAIVKPIDMKRMLVVLHPDKIHTTNQHVKSKVNLLGKLLTQTMDLVDNGGTASDVLKSRMIGQFCSEKRNADYRRLMERIGLKCPISQSTYVTQPGPRNGFGTGYRYQNFNYGFDFDSWHQSFQKKQAERRAKEQAERDAYWAKQRRRDEHWQAEMNETEYARYEAYRKERKERNKKYRSNDERYFNTQAKDLINELGYYSQTKISVRAPVFFAGMLRRTLRNSKYTSEATEWIKSLQEVLERPGHESLLRVRLPPVDALGVSKELHNIIMNYAINVANLHRDSAIQCKTGFSVATDPRLHAALSQVRAEQASFAQNGDTNPTFIKLFETAAAVLTKSDMGEYQIPSKYVSSARNYYLQNRDGIMFRFLNVDIRGFNKWPIEFSVKNREYTRQIRNLTDEMQRQNEMVYPVFPLSLRSIPNCEYKFSDTGESSLQNSIEGFEYTIDRTPVLEVPFAKINNFEHISELVKSKFKKAELKAVAKERMIVTQQQKISFDGGGVQDDVIDSLYFRPDYSTNNPDEAFRHARDHMEKLKRETQERERKREDEERRKEEAKIATKREAIETIIAKRFELVLSHALRNNKAVKVLDGVSNAANKKRDDDATQAALNRPVPGMSCNNKLRVDTTNRSEPLVVVGHGVHGKVAVKGSRAYKFFEEDEEHENECKIVNALKNTKFANKYLLIVDQNETLNVNKNQVFELLPRQGRTNFTVSETSRSIRSLNDIFNKDLYNVNRDVRNKGHLVSSGVYIQVYKNLMKFDVIRTHIDNLRDVVHQFILPSLTAMIDALHETGYIHNDLKMDNVMTNFKDEGDFECKLIDLAVTRPYRVNFTYYSLDETHWSEYRLDQVMSLEQIVYLRANYSDGVAWEKYRLAVMARGIQMLVDPFFVDVRITNTIIDLFETITGSASYQRGGTVSDPQKRMAIAGLSGLVMLMGLLPR